MNQDKGERKERNRKGERGKETKKCIKRSAEQRKKTKIEM